MRSLSSGEAGGGGDAAVEGAIGDADQFGEGLAVNGEFAGEEGEGVNGQTFAEEADEVGFGGDLTFEGLASAEDCGDGCNGHRTTVLGIAPFGKESL
jgi:hypothetical protein